MMALPGEKKLADKLLDLVKTARQQEATIIEQGKILHQMGELYLKDAIETGKGEQFVKASALINGALVRTEKASDQKTLQEILCKLYKGFIANAQETELNLSVEDLVANSENNKDRLHAIRVEVKDMCKDIEQFFDTYVPRDVWEKGNVDETLEMEELLIMAVKKVSSMVQIRMIEFLKGLWEQATEMYSIPPPCEYSVIGLGSIARQEMTPYSDLEFALLIEKNTEEIKQYFRNLVNLFHLLILDLSETPIPDIGIESLNDYQTPGGDRFFDRITKRGLRLDGAMPWACKTPIGRKETPQREPLDLMKTPKEMAELQKENSLGQVYHVADVLSNSILICGDQVLFEKYRSSYAETVSKIDHKQKAKNTLIDDYKRSPDFTLFCNCSPFFRNKSLFYRFPSTFVENLRMYFTPRYQSNSAWNIVEHLLKVNILSWKGAFNLKVHLAICFGFRLCTYFKNRGQYENIGFMLRKEIPLFKERPRNPSQTRTSLCAYFKNTSAAFCRVGAGSNAMRYVVENYFINKDMGKVHDLKRETFINVDSELDPNPSSWNRNRPMLTNLRWARSSGELPPKNCGRKCGAHEITKLSYIHKNNHRSRLEMMDDILNISGCKCLSLIRTSLLVSKCLLILEHNQVGMIPKEANIVELQEKYRQKKYKNMRERFYLLIDMSDMARQSKDKKIKTSVIEDITAFFNDVTTLDNTQKIIFEVTKEHIILNLIYLYQETGQSEKSFLLCEQQIDDIGEELGFDYLGGLYYLYGNIKSKCGLKTEALYYYQKAFEICRFGYENEEKEYARASLLAYLRLVACEISRVNDDRKEVCNVLEAAFTKNGTSFQIETDLDIEGMFLLWDTTIRTESRCNCFTSQYFEEILELIIRKGADYLKPGTVLYIVYFFIYNIAVFAQNKTELPFTKQSIEMGYKDCNVSKEDFLILILNILLEDECIPRYFVGREHFKVNETKVYSENFVCTWIGYLFMLSLYSLSLAKRMNVVCLVPFKARMAILEQTLSFCEKVVKKCVSETIYEMCLMFIEYNKIRYIVSISAYMKEWQTLQCALIKALTFHGEIEKFLDDKTHPTTDINWFNHRFLELIMNWAPFTRRLKGLENVCDKTLEDLHTDPSNFILEYFRDFRS